MRRTAFLAVVGLWACSGPPRVPVIVEPLSWVEETPAGPRTVSSDTPPPLTYAPEVAGPPPPASALTGEGFASVGEDRGVKIYRRPREKGIELACEGRLAGSPDRVLRVLNDYPAHRRWQKHLKGQQILGKGDGFVDVYERLELPILDDRDFVLHVTWGAEGDARWLRFSTVIAGGPPPVDGVVRITDHGGNWLLQPIDGGQRTYAVYRFHIDLAGSFPEWLSGQAGGDLSEFFESIDRELPRYP